MVNLGELIYEIFTKSGFTVVEFAKRINTSRENVYHIFKRKSIDTDLLYRISIVLNHNFYPHITPEQFKKYQSDLEKDEVIQFKDREIHYLKQIHELHRTIEELKSLNK